MAEGMGACTLFRVYWRDWISYAEEQSPWGEEWLKVSSCRREGLRAPCAACCGTPCADPAITPLSSDTVRSYTLALNSQYLHLHYGTD